LVCRCGSGQSGGARGPVPPWGCGVIGIGRPDRRTVGMLLPFQLLLFATTSSPAQVVPNRTTLYLHPTDVTGARALWVNPASLGRLAEASIHADVTVGDPGAAGRLSKLPLCLGFRRFCLRSPRD